MTFTLNDIKAQAAEEIEMEQFRSAVEKEKASLREKRNWPWHRKLFPFKIILIDLRKR